MSSQIDETTIDPTLPAETASGANFGKVLKSTFVACLTAIKNAITTAKSEISVLQTTTANLQSAINAIGGGTAGSVWRVTSGAPSSSLGINGDFVLNSANGDVYQKAGGAYSVVANIKGSTGAAGSQGAQGNTGAAGTAGRGITSLVRTAGNGAAGTTDTYTITYTDSATTTFNVVNGANGSGSSIALQDEGSALGTPTTINFTGAGVTASVSGGVATVNIPSGGGGSVTAPAYTADITAGRAIAAGDLSSNAAPVLLIYNSASNGSFTIPTDATLGISGLSNVEIAIYQKGTGRADVAAASGVTINNYAGAPTSLQYVTQRFHRVGANTWSMQ